MDIEKLKSELKSKFKIKVGMMTKNLYTQIAPMIPDDAEIEIAAEGMDNKTASVIPVIVTADKIYLVKYKGKFGGLDMAAFSRDDVTGIDISGGLLATVTIKTAADHYVIERLGMPAAQDLMRTLG